MAVKRSHSQGQGLWYLCLAAGIRGSLVRRAAAWEWQLGLVLGLLRSGIGG